MKDYAVHFRVKSPASFSNEQLGLRILFFLLVGVAGLSQSGVLGFLYLALPLYASLRISALGSAQAYLEAERKRIIVVLRWLASISCWMGLVTERLPEDAPSEAIELWIDGESKPTVQSAAWRIAVGLPSLCVLTLLAFIGGFVWLWCAVTILLDQQVPPSAHAYLTGLQRYTYRLLAYQASLVDQYPPFSLSESEPAALVQPQG